MADKKTGFEKAAEADMKARADDMVACVKKAEANGDLAPAKSKKAPRKASKETRALSQIEGILEGLPPETALSILKYHQEAQERKLRKSMFPPLRYTDTATQGCADPRRQSGGDLYTPPLPGFDANG